MNNYQRLFLFNYQLVFICVIRKGIECTFSHQELRALDDLLPGRKSEKRKLGYNKREESADQDETGVIIRKKERGTAIDIELEELMNHEHPKYRRVPSAVNMKVMRRVPSIAEKVILMFLRLKDDEVFIPIHFSPATYSNIISTIQAKFPQLKNKKVTKKLKDSYIFKPTHLHLLCPPFVNH